jgi:hypothetical protein
MIQGLLGPIASLAGTWLNGKVEQKAAQNKVSQGRSGSSHYGVSRYE